MDISRLARNALRLRKKKGLTQAQLATLAGVSRETVNHIEKGHQENPKRDTLAKLASTFGVRVGQLLEGR